MTIAETRERIRVTSHLHVIEARLGLEELHVLAVIADRLDIGQVAYGPLDSAHDGRDYVHEGVQEQADAAVYLAAESGRSGLPVALRLGLDRMLQAMREGMTEVRKRWRWQ